MTFNWNNNDTKYIVKKIIIMLCGLLAITILTTWKAHALEYTINKPTRATFIIKDEPPSTGTSAINNTNITNLSYIGDSRFWEIISYNNSNRLDYGYVFADFQESYDYQIVEFKFAFDVTLLGDIQDLDVRDFYVEIPNYVYQQCGIKSRTLEQRLSNQTTAVYDVHCVAVQPIQNINFVFQVNSGNYNNKKFFIGENIIVRSGTDEEIKEIIEQIQQEQQAQYEWLSNSYTNNADSSFVNDILNSPLFDDDTGLQSIITLPLHMVSNLSNTCQPINLTIPYINANVRLPCMSTIYQTHFNGIYTLVSVVVNGFFIYRILLKIYQLVHDAKDPAQDKLEVVDL